MSTNRDSTLQDKNLAWILHEALQHQSQANESWKRAHGMGDEARGEGTLEMAGDKDDGLLLTVLGCGTMGIAVLGGIMDSLSRGQESQSQASPPPPHRLPTRFAACVRQRSSAERIRRELEKYQHYSRLRIYENDTADATKAADVVLLACKPYAIGEVFESDAMKKACEGKLIISICAGVTSQRVAELVGQPSCTVIKAMPNTAAAVRESMTVIEHPSQPLPTARSHLIAWIFDQVGRVVWLPASNMDAGTALCGSGPAFVALMLESLAAGGVAMGLPRDEASTMAAQTMRGTTGLVLEQGEHPAILRDKVSTPGGCTIGGLLVLEEGGVRGTVAKAVREATVVASLLGQGKSGVNGTRRL